MIDTPLGLGMLTAGALVASDRVLIPVAADDEGAAQGLVKLGATIERRALLCDGQPVPTLAAVLTRWDPKRLLARAVEDALDSINVPIVGRIPNLAIVQQTSLNRQTLQAAAAGNQATTAYWRDAENLLAR